jgi:hypothetical protein
LYSSVAPDFEGENLEIIKAVRILFANYIRRAILVSHERLNINSHCSVPRFFGESPPIFPIDKGSILILFIIGYQSSARQRAEKTARWHRPGRWLHITSLPPCQ